MSELTSKPLVIKFNNPVTSPQGPILELRSYDFDTADETPSGLKVTFAVLDGGHFNSVFVPWANVNCIYYLTLASRAHPESVHTTPAEDDGHIGGPLVIEDRALRKRRGRPPKYS